MHLVFSLLFSRNPLFYVHRLEHTSRNLCTVILDARTPGIIFFIYPACLPNVKYAVVHGIEDAYLVFISLVLLLQYRHHIRLQS